MKWNHFFKLFVISGVLGNSFAFSSSGVKTIPTTNSKTFPITKAQITTTPSKIIQTPTEIVSSTIVGEPSITPDNSIYNDPKDCISNNGLYYYKPERDDDGNATNVKLDVCILPSTLARTLPDGSIEFIPTNEYCFTKNNILYCSCRYYTYHTEDEITLKYCRNALINGLKEYIPSSPIDKKPLKYRTLSRPTPTTTRIGDPIRPTPYLSTPVSIYGKIYNAYKDMSGSDYSESDLTQENINNMKVITLGSGSIESKPVSSTKTVSTYPTKKILASACKQTYLKIKSYEYCDGLIIAKNMDNCGVLSDPVCLYNIKYESYENEDKYLINDIYCIQETVDKIKGSGGRCKQKNGSYFYKIDDHCDYQAICIKSKSDGELKFDEVSEDDILQDFVSFSLITCYNKRSEYDFKKCISEVYTSFYQYDETYFENLKKYVPTITSTTTTTPLPITTSTCIPMTITVTEKVKETVTEKETVTVTITDTPTLDLACADK